MCVQMSVIMADPSFPQKREFSGVTSSKTGFPSARE
jgi:hypothetical protein